MKNNFSLVFLFFFNVYCYSQHYEFNTVIDLETTDVISQGKTGTCWSFSTSSFLESEIIRLTGKTIDLSEMYNVRNTYPQKAWNYVMRQGKAQFSEGGLAHDVLNSISSYGLVPNNIYTGLKNGQIKHNHSSMVDSLKTILNSYLKSPKTYASNWKHDIENTLDYFLGKNIDSFNYQGKIYTPKSFLKMTTINPDNYISITSFTHRPYYESFILSIPDNFSNGSYLNVTLDDLVDITNHALKNGYTIELDCDVSEKTFSSKQGVAVVPENPDNNQKALKFIVQEKEISPELRQQEFENYNTTDDHLMHITGIVKDQNENTYYKVKNSWGNDSERVTKGGYIYMSEAYFKLKTISITLHKDAFPKKLSHFLLKI